MGEQIINQVNKFRSEMKATQQDLANGVSVTRQTIIAIERGNYTPSVLLALKIAEFFNKPVEKIFKYEK